MNTLEYNIDKIIKYINESDTGFGWKNHPNRNHEGVYIKGEVFDYTIIKQNGMYCFDCKETTLKHWSVKLKDLRQAESLKKVNNTNHNIKCGFLIYFKSIKVTVFIDINDFEKVIAERKHVKFEDCKIFKLEEFIK